MALAEPKACVNQNKPKLYIHVILSERFRKSVIFSKILH